MNSPSAYVVLTMILGCPSIGSAAPVQSATTPLESKIFVIENARRRDAESVDIDDFIADLEKDAALKSGMVDARQWLAAGLEDGQGADLRALRLRAGLSQQGLASSVGMSQPNISAIESGKRQPEYRTAEKLAAGLNITVEEFYRAFEQTGHKA